MANIGSKREASKEQPVFILETIIFRNFLQFIFNSYCYDVTKQAYCKKLKGSVKNGLQKIV